MRRRAQPPAYAYERRRPADIGHNFVFAQSYDEPAQSYALKRTKLNERIGASARPLVSNVNSAHTRRIQLAAQFRSARPALRSFVLRRPFVLAACMKSQWDRCARRPSLSSYRSYRPLVRRLSWALVFVFDFDSSPAKLPADGFCKEQTHRRANASSCSACVCAPHLINLGGGSILKRRRPQAAGRWRVVWSSGAISPNSPPRVPSHLKLQSPPNATTSSERSIAFWAVDETRVALLLAARSRLASAKQISDANRQPTRARESDRVGSGAPNLNIYQFQSAAILRAALPIFAERNIRDSIPDERSILRV